jgi:lipid II:glycine glycyltransferase (peptidoglycan interpeptide bridge formation enzyme)
MKVDLVMAYDKEKPIAGAIMMTYGDTCYYLHGASDYEHRSLMAPYALHWENIKYLKKNNIKYYDFWGIDAKKWPGVTRFKLGWGGDTKENPGSFDFVVSRVWYLVYSLARKIL